MSIEPYEGDEPYLFISYKHGDRTSAEIMAQASEKSVRFWGDLGIPGGANWSNMIASKIKNCECFVALISKEYLASEHCCIELQNALCNFFKPTVCIFLDGARLEDLDEGARLYASAQQNLVYSDPRFARQFFHSRFVVKCTSTPTPSFHDAERDPADLIYQAARILYDSDEYSRALAALEVALSIAPNQRDYQAFARTIRAQLNARRESVERDAPLTAGALRTATGNGITTSLRYCPPGEFYQGSRLTAHELASRYSDGREDLFKDETRRKITLTKPFFLSQNETTVGEFRRFVQATNYITDAEQEENAYCYNAHSSSWCEMKYLNWRNPGFEQSEDHPVVCVSYNDALAYLDWLNVGARFCESLGGTPHFRLPTEAEWEYACRSGVDAEFFWGDDPAGGEGYLNAADETGQPNGKHWKHFFPFKSGFTRTSPVGSFRSNPWGLFDMLGNVWEWCSDRYETYSEEAATDPQGALRGAYRVLRGGAWRTRPAYCRSSNRHNHSPSTRCDYLGFRVAVDVDAQK